jgi:hypothetical protein
MPTRRTRHAALRCIAGFIVAAALPLAHAEPAGFQCAALVANTVQRPAYGPVAGEARCEGFYVKNVSQPFIEVVSLTREPPGSWSAGAEGVLQFHALAPLDTHLLVQPLRPSPLYRADLGLARGATVRWHGTPMLQATGLKWRDLGFVATLTTDAELPALVSVSTLPSILPTTSTATADDADSRIAYAVLRPSVAITQLMWRGYRMAGTDNPTEAWQRIDGPPLFAWERIALPITLPPDGHGMRIDVRGLDGQGQAIPLLQFRIVGARDDKP